MSFVSDHTKLVKAGKSGINNRFTSLSMQSQRKMCEIDQPHNNGVTDPKFHMLH